jgi:TRAP transporter 4TM/12TM fusion protein
VTHLEACKLGMKGLPKEECPKFFEVIRNGAHYLIPIGMLVYELVVVRHSPEMAAYNAVLMLSVIIFYQEIRKAFKADGSKDIKQAVVQSVKTIGNGLIGGSRNMVSVALATASAGIIVGVVGMGIGGMITQIVETLSQGNIFLLLLITAIASLLLGMGLPTTATYIVMASLTAPIIVNLGASYGFVIPLMAAHLFCFYFGILADDTPPVGLASYAAAAIADSPPIKTGIQGFTYDLRTAIIPFMFVFNTDLILHEIYSWSLGLLIFVMACVAAFAFTAAVQGWFLTKNKIWEIPLFLVTSFVLFRPGTLLPIFGLGDDMKYWMYLVGLAMFGLLVMEQLFRMKLAKR